MYRVLIDFYDLKDGSYLYSAGDSFPRAGAEPSKDRIKELLGKNNKTGAPVIEEIAEEQPEPKKRRKRSD